jgi:hypothetical protein
MLQDLHIGVSSTEIHHEKAAANKDALIYIHSDII